MVRTSWFRILIVAGVVALALGAAGRLASVRLGAAGAGPGASTPAGSGLTARTGGRSDGARSSAPAPARFPVHERRPAGPPVIELVDASGVVSSVSCAVCHSIREPNRANRSAADLDEFHRGMSFVHGDLACYSCHNPDDANTLRRADQTTVAYPDVKTLCAQCHGAKARDYDHGAHGGMNGYWDLTRGPRTRNTCIDCHDPHVPKFPMMIPTFKPRDRFLTPAAGSGAAHD